MRTTLLVSMSLALCAGALTIHAGPPLICHPFDIGNAKSLPWGEAQQGNWQSGWDSPLPGYDTKQLASETLKILDANSPVLVRMETMRRAALYGANDHASAAALLKGLEQRASATNAGANALFDYGYYIATLKQLEWKYKEDLTRGADGYTYVEKALTMNPDSAEMHFAAAIMTHDPRRPGYEEHARKARAGTSDRLLTANVRSHLD